MLFGGQTVAFEFIQSMQSGLKAPRWRAKGCRRTREAALVRLRFMCRGDRTLRSDWTDTVRKAILGVGKASGARHSRRRRCCRTECSLAHQVSW